MKISVITLFPEMFQALDYGICGRSIKAGLISLTLINPRDFASDKHRTADDRPYGGGPGMVMLAAPLAKAIAAAKIAVNNDAGVSYLSPQGKQLTQSHIQLLAQRPSIILLAGRYEGIDERVVSSLVNEEWSLGDYVLSGGELAAMVVIDAITRLLPGALGHSDSAEQDSFMAGLLDYPHYTRPEKLLGLAVPQVLLKGDHKAIARWRMKQAVGRTWLRRPDLLKQTNLDEEQRLLLNEFIEEHKHE